MKKALLVTAFALILCGCRPSTDEIGRQVKVMFQQKMNQDPEFSKYHLFVSRVDVVQEEGNKYQAIATVLMKGREHSVSMKILADGHQVMYETDPGALLFAVQESLQESPDPLDRGTALETNGQPVFAKAPQSTQSAMAVRFKQDIDFSSYAGPKVQELMAQFDVNRTKLSRLANSDVSEREIEVQRAQLLAEMHSQASQISELCFRAASEIDDAIGLVDQGAKTGEFSINPETGQPFSAQDKQVLGQVSMKAWQQRKIATDFLAGIKTP